MISILTGEQLLHSCQTIENFEVKKMICDEWKIAQ